VSDEPTGRLIATALWRRLDVPGLEHVRLRMGADGPHLAGTVLLADARAPLRLDYDVACSPDWATRRVTMTLVHGRAVRRAELVTDALHHWWMDGAELPAVAGCADVDLSLTPSTNTLPLRRLGLLDLELGESRDVRAAWVRFPELRVEALPQRYTRVGERQFRYESWSGRPAGPANASSANAFVAELEVDAIGLVVSYSSLWERVAVA
jgi:uncharacterized protein